MLIDFGMPLVQLGTLNTAARRDSTAEVPSGARALRTGRCATPPAFLADHKVSPSAMDELSDSRESI